MAFLNNWIKENMGKLTIAARKVILAIRYEQRWLNLADKMGRGDR